MRDARVVLGRLSFVQANVSRSAKWRESFKAYTAFMKVSVTDEGVLVPKELLEGVESVTIHKKDGVVMVVPSDTDTKKTERYSFFKLGADPIDIDITDASENHDKYR